MNMDKKSEISSAWHNKEDPYLEHGIFPGIAESGLHIKS